MAGTHGGRRSGGLDRRGPKPDPSSERSERRAAAAAKKAAADQAAGGVEATEAKAPKKRSTSSGSKPPAPVLGKRFGRLPRAGYAGPVPDWPLADASERESEVWKDLWRTPQAAAWSTEPWRWRHVALYARWSVRMEQSDATAATATAALRLADQIGLTVNGMRDNEWEVEEAPGTRAAAEHSATPADGGAPTKPKPTGAAAMQGRLTIVRSGSSA